MQTLVTGIGAITSIGNSVSENLQSLLDCHSGIAPMQILQTVHEVPAGEIKLTNSQLAGRAGLPTDGVYSRTMLLGLIAAREAIATICWMRWWWEVWTRFAVSPSTDSLH
jgi:3-oxoacyl-[acyl-carrier-protein] synthase II